jgi:hypothetical protein
MIRSLSNLWTECVLSLNKVWIYLLSNLINGMTCELI